MLRPTRGKGVVTCPNSLLKCVCKVNNHKVNCYFILQIHEETSTDYTMYEIDQIPRFLNRENERKEPLLLLLSSYIPTGREI